MIRAFDAVVASALIAASAVGQEGRTVAGVVRTAKDSLAIAGASVQGRDQAGAVIVEAVSDSAGQFRLALPSRVKAVQFHVRKMGMVPVTSQLLAVDSLPDSLVFEVSGGAVEVEAVRIEGRRFASPGRTALAEAHRSGWKVVEPSEVFARRESALDLHDLIRRTGVPGVLLPTSPGGCASLARTRQCLTYVIDGVVTAGVPFVNPRDIYFIAFVSPPDAALRFGSRVSYGAIVVVTRSADER